jgi:SAM-dependent methyltransferase
MQDNLYLSIESNAFFDRWIKNRGENYSDSTLRANKASILNYLHKEVSIDKAKVLEVGCFIGDLLAHLRDNYDCNVYGVEPSSSACEYARKKFMLEVENCIFSSSQFFSLSKDKFSYFDLIIVDDVLSWMSRDIILPVIGVIDWLLKPGGHIFIRDFSPSFPFRIENHHQLGKSVFNYKQAGGHRAMFLQSGKYLEQSTLISNHTSLQRVDTSSRVDSSTWADTILRKISDPLHPIVTL